jgi:anti-sigma factor RsiW
MLKYLRYRYAKTKMTAYINGELPPSMRRFIGRLINDDERVYNEYIRQRQTKLELERQLPAFGRPEEGRLNAIWVNIQAQLNTPDAPVTPPPTARRSYSLSYGVALGLCVLALLIPFAFDASHASAAVVPQVLETEEFTTPDVTVLKVTSVAVAARSEVLPTHDVAVGIQNTPAPRTPGQ